MRSQNNTRKLLFEAHLRLSEYADSPLDEVSQKTLNEAELLT